MKKYKNRCEVEDKYKWDLTSFYKDEEDFLKQLELTKKEVTKMKAYVGCTRNIDKLLEFIKKDVLVSNSITDLVAYANLKNDVELGNSQNILDNNKATDLYYEYIQNISFFNPELLTLSKTEYNNLFKNKEMKPYKAMLDKVYRAKDHILDEKTENVISELDNSMNHFDEMSSTMLNREHDYGEITYDNETETITPTNLRRLLRLEDRNKRKEVWEKYNSVLFRYGNTSASMLNGYVKSSIVNSRLHNYKDSWDRHLFNLNMKNEYYDALINTTDKNVDKLQRYLKLYKKILNVDKLYQYDLSVDISKNNKEYSIEDAMDITLKAVEPLGKSYQESFNKIFKSHYIDFCTYPGKCSGGYSYGTMDQDSRILMSYNYNLESISTIIHEGGHNVHHQIINKNNPLYYRFTSTLVAEVASLTNECLLSDYIYKNGITKNEREAGLINIIDVIVSNLFGAVREGVMEKDFYDYVSNGNTITKEYMDELTINSLKKYYGNTVELNDYSKTSWERRSHYYCDYYLFNYAFCISIASYIASEILKGNKEVLDNYMKYLTLGSDVYPTDAFKVLGIDLGNSNVYQKALDYFDSLLDKLELLIKE